MGFLHLLPAAPWHYSFVPAILAGPLLDILDTADDLPCRHQGPGRCSGVPPLRNGPSAPPAVLDTDDDHAQRSNQ